MNLTRKGGKVFVDVVSHYWRSTRFFLLHSSGIVGALLACSLSFSPSVQAQTSACSVSTGGATPTAADVTAAINMALGTQTCVAQVEGKNVCTVITVQRVFNAFNGLPCLTYNTHAAIMSWTASTTPGVTTYNVYRAAASTGPWTQIRSALSATASCNVSGACAWFDLSVQASQTYYYVVTAVASGVESAHSSPPIQATIPAALP
jgi:hypothetical protein